MNRRVPCLFLGCVLLVASAARPAAAAVRLPPQPQRISGPTAPAGAIDKTNKYQNFVSFDAPAATKVHSSACDPYCGTTAFGLNDAGVSVGTYTDGNVVPHAFIRTPAGRFTSYDAPGAGLGHGLNEGTVAYQINDRNEIVGQYQDSNKVYHSYVLDARGKLTTFDAPGAGTGPDQGTVDLTIDLTGETAGYYIDGNGVVHGFVRSNAGTISSFDPPGSTGTYPCIFHCVNDAGTVIGEFADANGVVHGFIRERNGKITQIDAPNVSQQPGVGTDTNGITPDGTITGQFPDQNLVWHGYLRSPNGYYLVFDAPRNNTTGTYPQGLNDYAVVAGQTQDYRAFQRSPDGRVATFAPPGAMQTWLPAINDKGSTAGWYVDKKQLDHGLIWTP